MYTYTELQELFNNSDVEKIPDHILEALIDTYTIVDRDVFEFDLLEISDQIKVSRLKITETDGVDLYLMRVTFGVLLTCVLSINEFGNICEYYEYSPVHTKIFNDEVASIVYKQYTRNLTEATVDEMNKQAWWSNNKCLESVKLENK